MKLRPILRSETSAAVTLLAEGFPALSRKSWQESVQRLFAHVEHGSDRSIGYIASQGGRDVGIGLAIPGLRSAYETEPRRVVNFAAFYLRKGNEWMTTLFLRRMMKDPSVEYLDITASKAMREVNRRLGFVDRTHGVVITPTALASMRPAGGVRIMPFDQIPKGVLSSGHMRLLEQHDRLQAISLAVEVDGEWHPLILVRSLRKRIPGARVVLARDTDLIRRVAGPVARHLMTLGLLFLEFDSPAPIGMAGAAFFRRAAPVQSTRGSGNRVIDHTFCELMFIPPPRNRPVFQWRRRRSGPASPFPLSLVDVSISAAPTAGILLNLADMLPV